MAFELDPGLFDSDQDSGVNIKIVGVGGCGGNAVNNMMDRKISGAEFVVFNTDRQALLNSRRRSACKLAKGHQRPWRGRSCQGTARCRG